MGDCEVTFNGCVNSPFYPAMHSDNEECSITVLQDGDYKLSEEFGVEECCDDLHVNDVVLFVEFSC